MAHFPAPKCGITSLTNINLKSTTPVINVDIKILKRRKGNGLVKEKTTVTA